MKTSVSVEGLADLVRELGQAQGQVSAGLGRAVLASTSRTADAVRSAAPRRTGRHVLPAIHSTAEGSGTATEGRVWLSGIAIVVATGAKPHEIKPKGRALKFGDRFAARVAHPGTRPNPFFDRGIAAADADVARELGVAGDEVVKQLAKGST